MASGRKERTDEERRAAVAAAQYLLRLRDRVSWQAEAAERRRPLRAIDGGLGGRRDPARVEEWRAGLNALRPKGAGEIRRLEER